MRAWFIKNVDKFIDDNTPKEFKLTLDDVKTP